jgi:hypothetical protein
MPTLWGAWSDTEARWIGQKSKAAEGPEANQDACRDGKTSRNRVVDKICPGLTEQNIHYPSLITYLNLVCFLCLIV